MHVEMVSRTVMSINKKLLLIESQLTSFDCSTYICLHIYDFPLQLWAFRQQLVHRNIIR